MCKCYKKSHLFRWSQEPDDDSHQRISIRSPANPEEDIPVTGGIKEREQRHLPGLVVQSSQFVPVQGAVGVMLVCVHQQQSASIVKIGVVRLQEERVGSVSCNVESGDSLGELANKEPQDIGLIRKRVIQRIFVEECHHVK